MRQRENLLDTLGQLLRRRKLLFKVTAAAAVLSIVLALVLPVYYKSSTTFLAVSPDQTNVTKIFNGTAELSVYGSGDDIERAIAVANSEMTVGFLIDTFQLYEVYDIHPQASKARYRVREALSQVYEVTRTRYDEIQISVEDKDPERAMKMANGARRRVELVLQDIAAQSRSGLGKAFREAVIVKESRRNTLSDSLERMSNEYGIVDVASQAEQLSAQISQSDRQMVSDSARLISLKGSGAAGRLRDTIRLIEARIQGNGAVRSRITRQLAEFAAASTILGDVKNELDYISRQMTYDRERLRQVETLDMQLGSVIIVLDEAKLADAKSRPVRWLIVVAGTLIAFVLAALGILLYENYKDVDWKPYLND